MDAITKYYKLSGLDDRNLFSHSSKGWKVQDQSGSRLVRGVIENLFPGSLLTSGWSADIFAFLSFVGL